MKDTSSSDNQAATGNKDGIGPIIKERFDNMPRFCTVSWLARELSCDRTNVYDIFTRKSIDTLLLYRLSRILNYNFLAILAQRCDAEQRGEIPPYE